MATTSTITVLGSVNLDLIIQTKRLPMAGETVIGGNFTSLPGGKGANVAVAAQRLGAKVSLIAAVGDDDYAQHASYYLTESGVDLSQLIRIADSHTGVAFISVSEDGENQIAVASGANVQLTANDLPAISSDGLISQFEIPMATIEAAAKDYKGFISLNASPVADIPNTLMKRADLIIVNQGEREYYKDRLQNFKGYLAITLGKNGAEIWKSRTLIATSRPPKIDVVDTTGAGDSFAAALTTALLEGQAPQDALDFACCVGALTTTKLGTQAATPLRADVDKLFAR